MFALNSGEPGKNDRRKRYAPSEVDSDDETTYSVRSGKSGRTRASRKESKKSFDLAAAKNAQFHERSMGEYTDYLKSSAMPEAPLTDDLKELFSMIQVMHKLSKNLPRSRTEKNKGRKTKSVANRMGTGEWASNAWKY